jgi:hypothetical protein
MHHKSHATLRTLILAAASSMLAFTTSTLAAPVPIINPGFESLNVTLRPGEQTNGAGGAPIGLPETPVTTRWQFPFNPNGNTAQSGVIVPGWRTANPGSGSLAGVLNPNVLINRNGVDTPWMTGYSGNHIATAQAAFMQQTLSTQVQPNTTYTLTFLAGIGITDSEYTPLIQLLAAPDLTTFITPGVTGVEFLARYEGGPIRQAQFGVMQSLSMTVTTPAVLPPTLQGKFLAIAFLGSDGIPRTNYDDFHLDATPVPSPGTLALLTIGAALTMRRRR